MNLDIHVNEPGQSDPGIVVAGDVLTSDQARALAAELIERADYFDSLTPEGGMTMHDDPRPAPTRVSWWARVTWQAEVASGMTLLGFDDWQAQQRRQDWLDDAANFADADEVVVRLASDAMTTDLKLTGAQVATMFRALAASEVNGDDDALAMIVSTLKGWNSGNGTGANLRKHYAEALDDMEAMIAALRNQDDDTLKRTNPQEQ